MKKLVSIVLALALVLASCAVAFAAAPTSGTLTIKNSEASTVYNFYRILDLALTDTDSDETNGFEAVTYTLNSKWHDFWTTGAGAGYLTTSNPGGLNSLSVDGTINYITLSESNIVTFTNAAMDYALENNISTDMSATGTGSDLAVTASTLGYYLMIPVDASIKTANSSGSVASIYSSKPNADILVKAIKPDVEKVDNVISADIGQTVTYTVTGTVPNIAGYDQYVYKIKDTMTSGLTFKKDVVVTIDTVTDPITSACTIDYTTDTNGFTVTIPVENYQAYIGKTITLTYTAIVNANAVLASNQKNEVQIIYGHDPDHLENGIPKKEELYTAKVIINKYTGDASTGPKLPHAKFVLLNSEGKVYKYTAAAGTEPAKVEWVEVTGGPSANTTTAVSDSMISAVTASSVGATIKETDENGAAEFIGLADGTYYLVEVEAPAGYNRLQFAHECPVDGTEVDSVLTENHAQAGQTEFDEARDYTANIQNNAGTELPSTGGIGTTIFYILGGLLVVGAAVILVARRKAQD